MNSPFWSIVKNWTKRIETVCYKTNVICRLDPHQVLKSWYSKICVTQTARYRELMVVLVSLKNACIASLL